MADDRNAGGPKVPRRIPEFDPDFSPAHPINRAAARYHRLRWDPCRECYVDADGCMIRDRFGQRF